MSKKITDLTAASTILDEDSFVLEQEGLAMRLPGSVLRKYAEDKAEDVANDIWQNLPQGTSVSVVKSGTTVTVTLTLEGGITSTSVITVDDNDYPVSIVTDGVACAVTWEGFDE